jgi:hypothetical protein
MSAGAIDPAAADVDVRQARHAIPGACDLQLLLPGFGDIRLTAAPRRNTPAVSATASPRSRATSSYNSEAEGARTERAARDNPAQQVSMPCLDCGSPTSKPKRGPRSPRCGRCRASRRHIGQIAAYFAAAARLALRLGLVETAAAARCARYRLLATPRHPADRR